MSRLAKRSVAALGLSFAVSAMAISAPALALNEHEKAEAKAQKGSTISAWVQIAYSCKNPKIKLHGFRNLTGLQVAMYFAGSKVDPRYTLEIDLPDAVGDADAVAAAAGAAYLKKTCDLDTSALTPEAEASTDIAALAEAAADLAIGMMTRTVGEPQSYVPHAVAGRFVPTRIPGDVRTAHLGHFAYDPKRATNIAPPPALDSDEYAASFKETHALGGLTSEMRTTEQEKATIVFDLQNPDPMIERLLATRDLSLFEQARVMAIYGLTVEDVSLAQFGGKLHFQSWRPITAIRRAELDERDDTEVDADWAPFLDTPNSSEYPCGHCTFVSASAETLKAILPLKPGEKVVIKATDVYQDPDSRGYDGDAKAFIEGFEMSFDSYDDFAEAGAMSRIHNGAHFRYSINAGMTLGKAVSAANLAKWSGTTE